MIGRQPAIAGLLVSVVVAGCASGSSPSDIASPSVAASTAEPSTASSASPSVDRSETLAAAFLERIRDPGARYRLDQTLTVVIGQASSEAISHSDVAGADRLIISENTVGGATTHSEYLQTAGVAFERTGDEDWRAVGPAQEPQVPFPFLSVSDMRYGGREIKGGAFLDAFSLAKDIPIGASVAESLGVMGGSASIVVFDCFVQPDGSPVRVEVGFQLDAADGSAAGYGTIMQDYAEFGGDIVVEPPIG